MERPRRPLQLITPNRKRANGLGLLSRARQPCGSDRRANVDGHADGLCVSDPKAVGYSAAIVAASASVIALVAFLALLKPFALAAAGDQDLSLEVKA